MNPSRFLPALLLFVCHAASADTRPNVLFVIVDDLRPELGCYGNTIIKTPNFDRFAASATTFTRAFCQAAACAPSRASVMLGQRPDTTRVWSLGEKFREINPQAVTMPQYFRKFGYHRQPKVSLDGKRYMGYPTVTPRYHYVQWHTWDNDQHVAGEQVAVELYDNQIDPDENVNIAGRTENAALLLKLAAQLCASRGGRRLAP